MVHTVYTRTAHVVRRKPTRAPAALDACSHISGKAGAWKDYVKTTFAEAHPNAPKLDDKLFADPAPPKVGPPSGCSLQARPAAAQPPGKTHPQASVMLLLLRCCVCQLPHWPARLPFQSALHAPPIPCPLLQSDGFTSFLKPKA